MNLQTSHIASVLAANSGIDAGYRHAPKVAPAGEPLELLGTLLKWYGLHYADKPIPDAITRLARDYLKKTPIEARGFGFVILHRCNNDFYFLIVSTWRGNNELWETVFYKNGDKMADFALFPRDGQHKGTYCVWEMQPMWHEREVWETFLNSARDEAAAREWLSNSHSGAIK